MNEENQYIICNCCGKPIRHNKEENADYGEEPYPQDRGYGTCRECGGYPDADNFKDKLGWSLKNFYDSRIKSLKEGLDGESLRKFKNLSYKKKCNIVYEQVDNGKMI